MTLPQPGDRIRVAPDTLRAAAAIVAARVANGGQPGWRRIADDLDAEAARIDTATTDEEE